MHDEKELVRRVQAGEASAFRQFVERYQREVYGLAYDLCGNHHDAEDLSQEVFIKVHRAIGSFRADAKPGSWLYRITMNAFLDSRRRKPVQIVSLHAPFDSSSGDDHPVDVPAPTAGPDRVTHSARVRDDVDRALDVLSAQERSVFVMRHYHDMPIREISASLSLAEGTVKSMLFRSIRKLRDRLSQYREEAGDSA
ncbi:MAG TPA: RNA polymerase sigma factor [Candidatus Krumholzibacteria bacterium]|nr:RNA polymerase sigma factor [Candidatus Krumholzibacteria bacterium]